MRLWIRVFVGLMVFCLAAPLGWAQGIDTGTAELPPDGVYVSPVEYMEYTATGLILDDPALDPDVSTTVQIPISNDELEIFDAEFTAIEIGLGLGPITLAGPVEVVTTDRLLSTTGSFPSEIVSMSLFGTTPLGPILIREDPGRASTGMTDIMDLGGGLYHIDSFFDVFTEVSVDGGASWIPSDTSTRMTLYPVPAVPTSTPTMTPTSTPTSIPTIPAGIDTNTVDLPPDGVYSSLTQFMAYAAMGLILDDPALDPDVSTTVRIPLGNDEREIFDAEMTTIEIGLGLGPITLTGPVEVVTTDRLLSTTGTFPSEIVSMSLSGSTPAGPILIREDPSRASTGITDIIDLGGGLYHIDSFFDVFTELSVDGGASWIPSDTSTRLTLYPVPGFPTPTPTVTPTQTPTFTPTSTPTQTPTTTPTATEIPTMTPTITPSATQVAATPTPAPIPSTGAAGVLIIFLAISGFLGITSSRRLNRR